MNGSIIFVINGNMTSDLLFLLIFEGSKNKASFKKNYFFNYTIKNEFCRLCD